MGSIVMYLFIEGVFELFQYFYKKKIINSQSAQANRLFRFKGLGLPSFEPKFVIREILFN